MFINKLNQIYKPDRLLYYIPVTEDDIHAYPKGLIPEKVRAYSGAFGTYDYPGVFYVKSMDTPVIGIEYRMDDERIAYPKDMECIRLEASFFYSVEMENEIEIDRESVVELFSCFAKDDDAHRIYSDLSIKDESDVIAVFSDSKKLRMIYESRLEGEKARYIIADDHEWFEKKELYKMAFFDPITGHYNWNHLVSYLEMPTDAGINDYAFVHFDIKEFRVINEVYGHIAANEVLSNVVKAMNEADFVYASARCHNDNFAMMIKDMPEEETIEVLTRFFDSISQLREDPDYHIYYRCGVVPMQKTIIAGNRVADAGKMAQALGVDKNKTEIIIYTDQMHDNITWGNFIKAYMDAAIARDEFLVYLQPKFDIRKNELKGAEALIRWNYKNKEIMSPGRFIPFFEKDGSIGKIDDIVMIKVCAALAKWKKEGKNLHPISVNLSRKRLFDENLIDHLTQIVDSYGVSRELIDFELTESATYDNTDHMIRVLEELRSKGFKISMDDFGTGYSSLSLLTEMPIDTLKIDKSFVDKIGVEEEREEDVTVIRLIITLAGELGFECLAEGAEYKQQIDRLAALGCDVVQGYYYSKPIPIEEFDRKYLTATL